MVKNERRHSRRVGNRRRLRVRDDRLAAAAAKAAAAVLGLREDSGRGAGDGGDGGGGDRARTAAAEAAASLNAQSASIRLRLVRAAAAAAHGAAPMFGLRDHRGGRRCDRGAAPAAVAAHGAAPMFGLNEERGGRGGDGAGSSTGRSDRGWNRRSTSLDGSEGEEREGGEAHGEYERMKLVRGEGWLDGLMASSLGWMKTWLELRPVFIRRRGIPHRTSAARSALDGGTSSGVRRGVTDPDCKVHNPSMEPDPDRAAPRCHLRIVAARRSSVMGPRYDMARVLIAPNTNAHRVRSGRACMSERP
jgi:hypothetical protein